MSIVFRCGCDVQRHVFVIVLLVCCAGPAAAMDGPLLHANPFPPAMWLNTPLYDTASVRSEIAFSLDHSSIYINKGSASVRLLADMETTVLSFRAARKFGERSEAGITLPFAMYGSGVFDSAVNSYHDVFGFPDYGRSAAPENRFAYLFAVNGVPVVKADAGVPFLGDMALYWKRQLTSGATGRSAVRLEAELPTGSAEKGQGSGMAGFGISLLADVFPTPSLSVHCAAGITEPGDLAALRTVETKGFVHGIAAAAYRLEQLAYEAVVQVAGQTSPFRGTGIAQLDGPFWTFGAGLRRRGAVTFELLFTEDLNTRGAPDFSLTFSMRMPH